MGNREPTTNALEKSLFVCSGPQSPVHEWPLAMNAGSREGAKFGAVAISLVICKVPHFASGSTSAPPSHDEKQEKVAGEGQLPNMGTLRLQPARNFAV